LFRILLSQVDYLAVDPDQPDGHEESHPAGGIGPPGGDLPGRADHTTGSLMKVYEGPAFVAAKTGATVLPVRLDGRVAQLFFAAVRQIIRRAAVFPKIRLTILPDHAISRCRKAATAKLRRHQSGEPCDA
jgi:acyl-[acyl-carrier-protein]-phospholipid O-acyltransferase/long-chain-fatty-acid--[acyl-carrier-protein] ligase